MQALLGQYDGCSVFIVCPPDVGLVPQNHPLCRSDAERGTFIACGTRNQCMRGSTERTPGEAPTMGEMSSRIAQRDFAKRFERGKLTFTGDVLQV